MTGRDVVVLEAEPNIGMHASSRNSEVIHAGLYYPDDSLKARLCVRGKELLYTYCEEHQIAHKRLGKLVVATGEDGDAKLAAIAEQARRNGVNDLRQLTGSEIKELEPEVVCDSGLHSPSTGIVDSHQLMLAFQAELEAHGGAVVTNSRVESARVEHNGLEFTCSGELFTCRTLVNAAGLWAPDLAADLAKFANDPPSERRYAKGHYFAYQARSPFKHLVYPLPDKGGLGIHATNDLAGGVRFGPDVEWVDALDYDFDESRKAVFVNTIREYFPAVDESKLVPSYTGIRAKLVGPDEPPADFRIETELDHGAPGLINLLGIESPGLTASLAIGEFVATVAH